MTSRSPSATGEPTLRLDPGGRILDADAAARELFGEDVAGRELVTLVAGAQRVGLSRLLASSPGTPLRTEVELDGTHRRSVELLLAPDPHPGDGGAALTAFLHDVSGRRLAERLRSADAAMIDAFAAGESPAQAARRLLAALTDALPSDHGSWFTRRPDGSLELAARWPAPPSGAASAGAGPDEPGLALATRALRAGEIVEQDRPGAVGVPLGGEAAAESAVVLWTDGAAPDAAAREALADVGARAGQLLAILQDRHSRIDALARLALTDELTGLPNRRAWEEMLARELAGAARDERPVCIAVLDLDRFKEFNDARGHQAGDRLLRDAAHAWQRQLRLSDLLARYGGEEFAAIIPAGPLPIATAVIERLRRATPGGLTASAGIASWDGAETGVELFGRADAALYAAKQAGRDRTVAAPASAGGASEPGRAREPLPRAS